MKDIMLIHNNFELVFCFELRQTLFFMLNYYKGNNISLKKCIVIYSFRYEKVSNGKIERSRIFTESN